MAELLQTRARREAVSPLPLFFPYQLPSPPHPGDLQGTHRVAPLLQKAPALDASCAAGPGQLISQLRALVFLPANGYKDPSLAGVR